MNVQGIFLILIEVSVTIPEIKGVIQALAWILKLELHKKNIEITWIEIKHGLGYKKNDNEFLDSARWIDGK